MVEDDFSIAFMFSTIYLRLEEVPPPPGLNFLLKMNTIEIPLCHSGFFAHAELAVLSHSESLWWEKIGKVVNWAKLAILSHSGPLRLEKIEKVANQVKLAILSHSEPFQWEKIGKVVKWAKLGIPVHSEALQ